MERTLLLVLQLLIVDSLLQGQDFLNNDLDGIEGISQLPDYWQAVPYTDFVCSASSPGNASPDLHGPSFSPYEYPDPSTTFVSGLKLNSLGTGFGLFQEGIQQLVTGFVPEQTYDVGFYQCALIQNLCCQDQSGSWMVYRDGDLIGTSVATQSEALLAWEHQVLSFTATATSHLIKFLPTDDEINILVELQEGVRMAIDSIYIVPNDPTNVPDHETQLANVYPNPSNGSFTITVKENADQRRIELVDMTGRIVLNKRFHGSTKSILDTSSLAPGTYIVYVISDQDRRPAATVQVQR